MIEIKEYTQQQLDFLCKNFDKYTVKQLAYELNKTPNSVYNAARKLGLHKQIHSKWSKDEDNFLKCNYLYMSNSDMAKYLKRSFNSISSRLDALGLIRNKSWSEYELDYIRNNYIYQTHAEIGMVLNRSEQAVRAKCFDMNLVKKELSWSKYELDFLRDNYFEVSNADIAKALNRSVNAIHIQASKMGMKKSPYKCDYHYFDEINTEEKAYWLGFLSADGWISRSEKSNACVTGIELQYKDINHLKKFNKSISGNYQITDRWRTSLFHGVEKKAHSCVIRIFSTIMYDSLIKKNFTNNKSFDFHIPCINDKLMRHYIRGYFDGNGCFTLTNKTFSIGFSTASELLSNDIVKTLSKNNIECHKEVYVSEYGTNMYPVFIYKKQDKLNFLDWIYSDCSIYLERKYRKYLKLKKYN